jgi:torulene dioxygenase
MIFDHHQILAIALAFSSSVFAEDNPAVHGPPEGVSPLTYGFYATPEVREPISLNVTGHIPPWLTGTIYRQAAASFDAGNYSAKHWFDGWDRQHSFVLSNGSVTYRSRNGSDELTAYVAETGHFPGGSFWGDPCKIKLGEYEAIYRDGIESFEGEARSDSVPVAFIANFPQLAQNSTSEGAPFLTLVATTDNTHLKQIDPLTLEPIEQFSYQLGNPDVPTGMRASAHQVEAVTVHCTTTCSIVLLSPLTTAYSLSTLRLANLRF